MGSVAVLMPSLRPETWERIEKNLAQTAPEATLYPLGEKYNSYTEAIQAGYEQTTEPWLFLGADDLSYHDGWLEAALGEPTTSVVGTNDLRNPYVLRGQHSTHSLVSRLYLDNFGGVIDQGAGSVLYPYAHQYTDVEFVETAIFRGMFTPCPHSHVEHLHPDFKTREADAIDKRTRAKWAEDYDLFISRRHLWEYDDMPIYRRPV